VWRAVSRYTADDICWDMAFAPCVFPDAEDGGCSVDFDRFHSLVSEVSRLGGMRGLEAFAPGF
jgi:hypothetical protein